MMLCRHTPIGVAVAALMLAQGQAWADGNTSAFRFSGFGTVGFVTTDTDTADFLTSGQVDGANEGSLDFGVDSRIGVQGAYQFNSMFSGTVQVISKYNGKGNHNPNIEWAFVKAQVTPTVGIRVGRIGAPFFMISDYRDVNYSNLWVRPPLETYGQVPVSNFAGADVIVQYTVGSAVVNAQLWGGQSKATLSETTDVKVENQLGLSMTAEFDNGLTLRVGHSGGKVTIATALLGQLQSGASDLSAAINGGAFDGFVTGFSTTYGPGAAATSNDLGTSQRRASFTGIGASWDVGNWQLNGEFTHRFIDGYIAKSDGWYASAGYRTGKFTPYIYASGLKIKGTPTNGFAPAATLLGGPVPALAALSGGVDAVLDGNRTGGQKSVAIGTRWDAFSSAAVKFQLEHIKPDNGGVGLFAAPNGTSFDGKSVNVLSVSVDFVF